MRSGRKIHVAVVGAGAFGGWTALHLLRRGAQVTLLDAWGPGNARASSGGETRIIRAIYPDQVYVEMAARALPLWREHEARWHCKLYRHTGLLWMVEKDGEYERAALPLLRAAGIAVEELTTAEAARRYPQINFAGVPRVLYEKEAGYLTARYACQVMLEGFLKEGGEYRQRSATPGAIMRQQMPAVTLSDGATLSADQYVFACGPWLGTLFPDVIGDLIRPTRQEVFFFGTPAGDARFGEEQLPIWLDNGPPRWYGIPGNKWRGFKIADDTRGAPFDPTSGNRIVTVEGLQSARDYLEFRFPALTRVPLVETRVCQYEETPDGHFIIDRHPSAENVWLVGGGSGHGFKHGPVVGEYVADLVLEKQSLDPFFRLSRFSK